MTSVARLGVKLDDLDQEPMEFNDLAGGPRHAATVAELKARVDKNRVVEYKPVGEGKKQ